MVSENQLGKRIVAGKVAIVDEAPLGVVNTFNTAPDQQFNRWSNRVLSPEEELISCKRQIKELQEKIAMLDKHNTFDQ